MMDNPMSFLLLFTWNFYAGQVWGTLLRLSINNKDNNENYMCLADNLII